MAQIGSLSVKLGLVTAEWDKATDKAKQQAKDLQKAFDELGGGLKKLTDLWKMLGGAIGVGSIGLVGLIQQTAEYADKIDDLSKAFGVSAGFALQFSNALEQAGVSADNASKAMTTLFTNIESAREGNQEAVDLFRKMGIGFNDIKQMQPEQAIRKVVDSLADLQKSNPIAYVQELRKNLGRGGIGLDAEQVNDILKNGIDKWNNYGERLEKVSRIHDNLKQSYNNLLIAFSDFIAPFTRDGVVAVEKFTGALAGMFTYLVATRIASAAVAMWEIVTALRAAATAGAAFNIVAAGNPIGLLLSLAAAGTAFLVYQKESGRGTETVGEISYDPMGSPISSGTASILGGGTANKPSVATPSTSESTSTTGEYTPKELSSFAQLAAEKFKTMNAQIMASIPVWNTFAQKVIGIQTEADVAIKNIAAKRQEAMATYKTSPVLLEAELGKLREQEKQIKINRDRKIEEAQTTESIYNVEQMRLVNLAYFEGRIANTVALTQRQLATNQALLQIEQTRIRNETELSLLALQTKSTLDDSVKAIIAENINFSATIDLLKNELNSLPEYIDLPADMLSQEAEANNRRIDALKAQIDLETKRHDLRMAYFQQERTFEYGMTMAVNQLVDNATNHAKLARSMVDSVFSNMTNAIDAFVKTGKFSFYDFRKSVIQDLIAIQMKAQTISILKSVWSAATSLTVGTSTGPDNIDVGGGWNPARAEGGPVDSGKIGLVGERGPELFVPKVPGTIIPNNQLGNIGGSTTINNYNINAIDAKSFEERLYESSRAIWAANQYATKNLATNRSRT